MRHLARFVTITILILTLFAVFSEVHPARAACLVASGTVALGQTVVISVNPTHTYTVTFGGFISPGITGDPTITFINFINLSPISYSIVDSADCSAPNSVSFTDGRLNKFVGDDNQTAAIYCSAGTIEIYSNKGAFLFRVTSAELAKFTPKATPQLVKQKNGVRLYLLDSGQLQVNAPPLETGKPDYSFIFDACK